jgi:hypothetical protein
MIIRSLAAIISLALIGCGSGEDFRSSSHSGIYSFSRISSTWDYSQWPWLSRVKRDIPMTEAEGKKFYSVFIWFTKNETLFRAAIKDGYDSVPWARSAPCATTTSAVLEHSMERAGFTEIANLFGQHDKFGPTHNVEIALYRIGWNYWPKSHWKSQVSIGLLDGRFVFHGTPKHSGHIYTIFSEINEKYDLIGDNGGYNHQYRGRNWEIGTEGFWLPPGVKPERR